MSTTAATTPNYQIPWNELSFHQQYNLKEAWVQHQQLKSELLKAEIAQVQARTKAILEGKYPSNCCDVGLSERASWNQGTTCYTKNT